MNKHYKTEKGYISIVKDKWKHIFYYLNGKFHREDGPAIESASGDKHWFKNGKRHREDGPAVEYANGDKYWYLNGKRHREDGPAIEYPNAYKEWWINGQRHRVEYLNKAWYTNGLFKLCKEPLPNINFTSKFIRLFL